MRVVFQGHEHNYQVSLADAATSGIRFFITGSGGQLRSGNVRSNMANAHIEAWAPHRHFLVVDIDGKTMTVEPRSYEPVVPVDRTGAPVPPAVRVTLP